MWLWLHLPLLTFVQFPWRLYGPLSLGVAMAAAGALAAVDARPRSLSLARATAFALAAVLAAGSFVSKPYHPGPLPARDVGGQDLFADETNRYGGGTASSGEFLPKTVRFAVYTQGHDRGIMLYDDARDEAGWQAGLVRVLDGQAAVTGISRAPNWVLAQVQAESSSTIAFHQLLFPGWRAYVDGRAAALRPAPYVEQLQAWLGYMVVDVPPGAHRVEVRFGPTGLRLASDALSAATAAALLVVGGSWLVSRRPHPIVCAGFAALAAALVVGLEVWAAGPARSVDAGARQLELDVAGAVAGGNAETATPSGSGSGPLPPFLDVRYQDVGGEVRRWLYMHPPSRAAAHLRVPPHAYLQAGLALDPRTWETPVGDGVRFVVEADGPGGRTVLMDRRLNPRANVDERRWVDVWVSLEALTGQEVTLTLRTDPVEDLNFDWAGWANPQIVTWQSARPNPGTPHPY